MSTMETIDIGPECFASADHSVICWQGENYYRVDELPLVADEITEHAPWKPYKAEPFARLRGLRVLVQDRMLLRRARKRSARCERCASAREVHPTWSPGEIGTVHFINNHDGANPERRFPE